jgi:DNA mismatch repair ATPase MutS
LFATHFGQELAQLMAANKSVKGLDYYRTSLKFNGENQFLFDHRLQPGISEASHGLAVAALAGFPDRALQDAKHALSLHEDRFL